MVGAPPLRVVFFGTPSFAVPTLNALLASRHSVVGAVTQPDRPRGRGQKLSPSPVKDAALAAGLPVLQPESAKTAEFAAELAALDPDIVVVAAYGQILSERLLSIPSSGMINVHASLLPRYRGAAPVHRAIINGETTTGVTIMRMVKALDAGPMIAVEPVSIGSDETSVELEDRLARVGAALLARTLDEIAAKTAPQVPQDDLAATYAPRLTKDDGRVEWSRPALHVHNQIRGLHPWPHAVTFAGADRLILHRSRPSTAASAKSPGTVLMASGDRLSVATGEGTLDLLEIQVEGKRPMQTREFLAGRTFAVGTLLHPKA
jgi:methionyl-tRNA formyltransferase